MKQFVLSASELRQHARIVLGKDVAELSTDEIVIAMTFCAYVTELCSAELERREALGTPDGMSVAPHASRQTMDHVVARLPHDD